MTIVPQKNPAEPCTACGAPLAGKFCSSCGTPATGRIKPAGWIAIIGEVTGLDGQVGPLATLLKILRRPVSAPVTLALEPSFRGHVSFFAVGLALITSAYLVGLPRLLGWLAGSGVAVDSSLVGQVLMLQYGLVIVAMPLTFYLLRLVSPEQRRPMTYYKLYLMATVVSGLVFVVCFPALLALLVATALALIEYTTIDVPDSDAATLTSLRLLLAISSFLASCYVAAVQARFWSVPYAWTLALTLVLGIAVEQVSPPLLAAIRNLPVPFG